MPERLIVWPAQVGSPPPGVVLLPDTTVALKSATVTLTDAQIKTLPTAPVQVVAAAGAGKVLFPVQWFMLADFQGGAYGNLDAAVSGPNLGWSNVEDAERFPVADSVNILTTVANKVGLYQSVFANAWDNITDFENTDLNLTIDNGATGNLTGGNAANTLRITVYYLEVSLA